MMFSFAGAIFLQWIHHSPVVSSSVMLETVLFHDLVDHKPAVLEDLIQRKVTLVDAVRRDL
jgi:hypothetical protein